VSNCGAVEVLETLNHIFLVHHQNLLLPLRSHVVALAIQKSHKFLLLVDLILVEQHVMRLLLHVVTCTTLMTALREAVFVLDNLALSWLMLFLLTDWLKLLVLS